MAQLEHPGIISVLDYGTVPPAVASRSRGLLPATSPYLVMEYAPPQHLGMIGALTTYTQLRDLLVDLLRGLGHAHARGVVHRDLKPENVLAAFDEAGRVHLKLTDFGLAHSLHASSEQRRGITEQTTAGTPRYMAPEQIMGRFREFGPWTDLYALGCLVYHLCTGSPPFDHADRNAIFRSHALEAPPALKANFPLPKGFDGWLARLLAKAPLERFHTAAHAERALLELDNSPKPPPAPRRGLDDRVELEGTGLGLFGLRPTPLIGRDEAWAQLETALSRVVEARTPQMVVLQGSAGLGKSRLLQNLAIQAHERGVADHIRANHTPFGQPGRSLLRALGEHLRCLGLSSADLATYLGSWLEARGRKDDSFASKLATILAPLAVDYDDAADFDNRIPADTRHGVILELLTLLTERAPIILSLDNAQWGPDSLALTKRILASKLPVLIVASILTDGPMPNTAPVDNLGGERIALEPLPDRAIGDIVRSMLPLERALVDHVVSRTEGNPLFAVQLVADFVERGALMLGRYGFRLKPGAHVLLPASIHQAWTRRLERIAQQVSPERTEATLLALELVAAFGGTVITSELAMACRLQGFTLPENLAEQLAGEGLASAAESGWSLRPAALQDTLVRLAHESGRWSYHHMTCASALDALYRQRVEVLERVGRHYAIAQAPDRAISVLKRAFLERLAQNAPQQATQTLSLLETILSQTGEPPGSASWRELRLLRATLAAKNGEMPWADWQKVSRHGLEQLEPVDAARALEDAATLARTAGEAASARSALIEAAALWEQLGNIERAEALRGG